MFGFKKKEETMKTDDYANPGFVKGIKYLSTMPKEDLLQNKQYAMMLTVVMDRELKPFFNMIRSMNDQEYKAFIEHNLH